MFDFFAVLIDSINTAAENECNDGTRSDENFGIMITIVGRRRDGISGGIFATNFAAAISFGIAFVTLFAGNERSSASLLFATASQNIEIITLFADNSFLSRNSFTATS